MFNFKAQVNFIFCIPHIDHGSLLLKSQKKMCLHMDGADENSVLRLSTVQSKMQTSEG